MANCYIAILDVGHGNACVVADTNGVLLIDSGLGTALLEFLEQHKITTIDVALLSHADADHISGLVQLLASQTVEIKKIRLNPDAKKATRIWSCLAYELDELDRAGKIDWQTSLTAGMDEVLSCGVVEIEVLAPSKYLAALGSGGKYIGDRRIDTNSVSGVIRLSSLGKSLATLPGDLDEIGLDELVRTGVDPSAPILVYPHHGGLSGAKNEEAFAGRVCDIFKPETVIFSIGRGKHETPRVEIVDAIRRKVKQVRIACTQLSEHCAAAAPAADSKHLSAYYAKGRNSKHCCAGTFVIEMDGKPSVLPEQKSHFAFVELAAPTALCQRKLP